MKLKPDQVIQFFKLFNAAWRQHCADKGFNMRNPVAREQWRHEKLVDILGLYSLKQVPRTGEPYVKLMAELEKIARNGIYWQLRLEGAATRPLAHTIRELCRQHEIDEDYARGITRKALALRDEDPTPDIEKLKPDLALKVLYGVRDWVNRRAEA